MSIELPVGIKRAFERLAFSSAGQVIERILNDIQVNVWEPADEAAMLALTSAKQGDIAVRGDGGSYVLSAEPASTLANWIEVASVDTTGIAVEADTVAQGDFTTMNVDTAGGLTFTDDGEGTFTLGGGGGAGGVSMYDATVGAVGADYTTIASAVTGGKRRLLVIDDTTEVAASIVLSSGTDNLLIDILGGVTCSFGDCEFQSSAGTPSITIRGLSSIDKANLVTAHAGASAKVFAVNTIGSLLLENLNVLDSSTTSVGAQWHTALSFEAHNCKFENSTGSKRNFILSGLLSNIELGDNDGVSYNAISGTVYGVSVTGTHALKPQLQGGRFYGVVCDAAIGLQISGHVFGLSTSTEISLTLDSVVDGFSSDVAIAFTGTGGTYPPRVVNGRINANQTINYAEFLHTRIIGDVTISGSTAYTERCHITGNVTITGDSSTFNSNRVDGTVTINAGGDNNILVGNRTGGITDNGAGNVVSGNI